MATRRFTDEDKVGILETLTGGVSEVFSDTSLLFNDRAAFVAGEGSDSPLAQSVRALTRLQCRIYARDPGDFSSAAGAYIGDVCGPYLEGLGEDPLPATAAPPQITGGQCPGINYQVQRIGTGGSQQPINVNLGNFVGPISFVGPAGTPQVCAPNRVLTNERYVSGTGATVFAINQCAEFPVVTRLVCTPLTAEPGGGCGNAGPQFNPPTARPGLPALSPTTSVNLPGAGPVNVTVGFDADGNVTVNLPEFGVSGTVNVGGGGGDDGGDGGGGGGGDGPPGDVGSPGAVEGTGEGGEADGEAPGGSVLVGLRIDFAAPPLGGTEYAPGVYRGVCYVYMGTEEGLDHDPAGAMLRSGQFVFAEKANLTHWRVSANRGYNLSVTPYYREVTTESE